MCFGGNSAAKDARLAMIQNQQNLQATQAISPAVPMRSDEQRTRTAMATINGARQRSGFSQTILTGGLGDPTYGSNVMAPVPPRAILGG